MEFRTVVDIPKAPFQIEPAERVLLVGSCFAGEVGSRFCDNGFAAMVNPYGTMYNPASILHTVRRLLTEADGQQSAPPAAIPSTVFLTLGTNHVYRLKETGEIVDNCAKRPAALFREEQLSVSECTDYLRQTAELLLARNAGVHVVFTVSPIRYRKYGYHGSQLSKATLLLAVDELLHPAAPSPLSAHLSYFPAYEIFCDELRDYRFYAPDMLHPSEQAVDYVWERLVDWCFSPAARAFMDEWRPIRQALQHRPFQADSDEYRRFRQQTQEKLEAFRSRYPQFVAQ